MKRLNSKFTQSQLKLIQAGDKKFRMYWAISLKYYEVHNEFVTGLPKISGSLLKNISKNLGLKKSAISIPSDRAIRRFRTRLKQYFNSASEQNHKKDLRAYLTAIISSEGIFEYDTLKEYTVSFLGELGKSSVSALTISRIIKSTLHRYEKGLFSNIAKNLDNVTKAYLDGLLITLEGMSWMNHITRWMRGINASSIEFEVEKLRFLKLLNYPPILTKLTARHLKRYYRNIVSKYPSAIKEMPDINKYAQLAIFCFVKKAEISDTLTDILINATHKIFVTGINKSRLKLSKLKEVKKNYNTRKTLKILVNAILDGEDNIVKEAIYPQFAKSKLVEIRRELSDNPADTFDDLSYENARSSFTHYYRKIIAPILEVIEFDSDNKDLIRALELIKTNINSHDQYYTTDQKIAFDQVVKKSHRKKVLDNNNKIKRIDLELCTLHKLRNKLRVKEVWIKDGYKYRNPEYDLPQDFDDNKDKYFSIINQTQNADEFVLELKNNLKKSLSSLSSTLPKNQHVQILKKPRGHVKVAKLSQQEPPKQLELIKSEVFKRWPCTSLCVPLVKLRNLGIFS
jgi:hypothetical protein